MESQKNNYPRNSKEYYQQNKERIRAQQKIYRELNKEKCRALEKEWAKNNPDKLALARKRRLERVPEIVRAEKAAYKSRCRSQMPSWANIEAIKSFYVQANSTGMSVDHIIPLKGKTVCGLHVENNLRVISKNENSSKGNRYLGEQN